MEVSKGWCFAVFSKIGLVYFSLPHASLNLAKYNVWKRFEKLMLVGDVYYSTSKTINTGDDNGKKLYFSLLEYFEKGSGNFDIPLDWENISDFARKVYEVVSSIPSGEVRTYNWVAKELGDRNRARAVGQALKKNPFPLIIPCHRVIAAKGLGGFTGGIELKKELLNHEGFKFKGSITG